MRPEPLQPSQQADETEPIKYILIYSKRANAEVEAAYRWFEETASETIAVDWVFGFFELADTFTRSPRRFPVADESRLLKTEVRQAIYRRPGRRVAYKILFTVNEPNEAKESKAAESREDAAPFVRIVHIRHGARRPMTKRESGEIRSEQGNL